MHVPALGGALVLASLTAGVAPAQSAIAFRVLRHAAMATPSADAEEGISGISEAPCVDEHALVPTVAIREGMDSCPSRLVARVVEERRGIRDALELVDLNSGTFPPILIAIPAQSSGVLTAWLPPSSGAGSPSGPYPDQCFGTGCPCSNDNASGGCENSLGCGAFLHATGDASLTHDTLVLIAGCTPNQPGIFFQGDSFLNPAPDFGAGFRCCGTNVVRCGVYLPTSAGTNTSSGNLIGGSAPPISQIGPNVNLVPGDVRCYQWWYRDPTGPCGSGFNLSNSISVTWGA